MHAAPPRNGMVCSTCGCDCTGSRCRDCANKDVKICRQLKEMSPAFQEDWKNALKSKMLTKKNG